MQVKLVVVGGTTKNQEIRLRLPTTIGRGRMCTLQLPHPLVSRQHCEIFLEGGKLRVRDLGSLNGTFVNGQKCTVTSLPAGSTLVVGTVSFKVVYETSEPAPRPAVPLPAPPLRPTPVLPVEAEPLADFAQPGAMATQAYVPRPTASPAPVAKASPLSEAFEVGAVEDFVEVVEDVTDMMPPAADAGGTAISHSAAPSASPPPARPITNSDDDLDRFLKSLGDR